MGARTPRAVAVGAPEMAVGSSPSPSSGRVGVGFHPRRGRACDPHPTWLRSATLPEDGEGFCGSRARPGKQALLDDRVDAQWPSATSVTPKSTAMDISEIASSSLNPLVVIRNARILRNASLRARSIEDFS